MKSIARTSAALFCAAALLASGTARADDQAWREFRGQVLVSDVLLAPSFDSDQELITTLRRVKCSTVTATYGFWRLHLVAFLDPAAGDGTETAALVARDVTNLKERKGARLEGGTEVKVFEVPVQPGQKVVQMNDFVLSESMGFERGHDYELTVETSRDAELGAGAGEKRDVNARGVVTLR
jgi:hypothetical protein